MPAKTHIQSVRNDRNTPIDYQVLENNGCNRLIPAGATRNVGCDVPWAYSEEEFLKKRLEIQDANTGQVVAQIWSREKSGNDLVRVSTTGYSDPGNPIGGVSKAGGKKRLLVVGNNGVALEDIE
jgi:hypothetical protein